MKTFHDNQEGAQKQEAREVLNQMVQKLGLTGKKTVALSMEDILKVLSAIVVHHR